MWSDTSKGMMNAGHCGVLIEWQKKLDQMMNQLHKVIVALCGFKQGGVRNKPNDTGLGGSPLQQFKFFGWKLV